MGTEILLRIELNEILYDIDTSFANLKSKNRLFMKVGLLQYSPSWENPELNKTRIINLLSQNSLFELLVMPELTLLGFTMNSAKFAENLDGDSFDFYSKLAREFNLNISGGIIERENSKYFNSLLILNRQGQLISRYRKIHPFSFSGEDKHYTGGFDPVIAEIDNIKTGLSICYDLRFPELYRTYAKQRVHLILNVANWPDTRIDHWRALLKARAIENQCYVIGVNRIGDDPALHYNGFSSVYDPMGVELLSSADDEKILICEIDIDYLNQVRNNLPFLRDMRLI